jgi:hypothetical protein
MVVRACVCCATYRFNDPFRLCVPKASSVGRADISPLEPANSGRLFFIQLWLASVVLNAITILL